MVHFHATRGPCVQRLEVDGTVLTPLLLPAFMTPSIPFLPFPSPSSPSHPLLPLHFPCLPLITVRGYGERYSSPNGSGRSPAAKRILVQFKGQNLLISFSLTELQKKQMQHFETFSLNKTYTDSVYG